ncbi:hypothetical protein RND81_03G156000 [Saponaria officinalis]|uniref:Uncharacterized protein n=1 Tax=Saponaria officinalis TaxID=3572 RepID=A0AAW1M0I7_SAPOF
MRRTIHPPPFFPPSVRGSASQAPLRIKTAIDPSLVAGFTIGYGDGASKLVDLSVKTQLEEIASQLDLGEFRLNYLRFGGGVETRSMRTKSSISIPRFWRTRKGNGISFTPRFCQDYPALNISVVVAFRVWILQAADELPTKVASQIDWIGRTIYTRGTQTALAHTSVMNIILQRNSGVRKLFFCCSGSFVYPARIAMRIME